MELAQPAGVRPGGLPGVEVRERRPLPLQLEVQRLVDGLDGCPRRCPAALGNAADPPSLLRQLLAGREVDARELEERDRLIARVDVDPRRRDEALDQGRPQDRLIGRQRLRNAYGVGAWIAAGEAPRQ